MATFEVRRDAAGRINAVRVKLRAAGHRHLSRTFRLSGPGASALATARRQAEEWLDELEASFRTVSDELTAPTSGTAAPNRTTPRLRATFAEHAAGATPAVVRSPAPRSPAHRLLAALRQCGPVEVAELAALRWRHVAWHERTLHLPGVAGIGSRLLPLTATAVEALLTTGARKHGLVFPGGVRWLQSAWEATTPAASRARRAPGPRTP